ncbi:MAG: 2-hydroxyacyl-CoA dehydratase family protein [bacterium]
MDKAIPEIFRELLERPVNRFVDEARDSGNKIIGYTCSYVPEPLIGVDGLVPVRMRAPGVAGTPMADTYLSSVICSYCRSLLEFALDGVYDGLDGWVFTGSCDHLRRLHDNLAYLVKPAFNHIIDLPHKLSDEAVDWFAEELKTLADALSESFDVDTSEASLAITIEVHNEYLELMQSIGKLRKRDNPPISGADFHTLIAACDASPKGMLLDQLWELKEELEETEGISGHRARLMLVGSQLDDPAYIRVIESLGGLVVADRCCLGSIPGLEPIAESGDPLRTLAEHYLRKTSCPRMMEEFDSRVADIVRAAEEFNADGIVVETMKFCDTWGVESSPLVSTLREAGIPVLRLEREYSLTGEGQMRTRVQAFLESMGK